MFISVCVVCVDGKHQVNKGKWILFFKIIWSFQIISLLTSSISSLNLQLEKLR